MNILVDKIGYFYIIFKARLQIHIIYVYRHQHALLAYYFGRLAY